MFISGVSNPRAALSGHPLPPASIVSSAAHAGDIRTHAHVSLLAAVWGQYLAHDLSRPTVAEGVRGERVRKTNNLSFGVLGERERLKSCACVRVVGVILNLFCMSMLQLKCCGGGEQHPECYPIRDQGACWEYARTAPATTTDCALGMWRTILPLSYSSSVLHHKPPHFSTSVRFFIPLLIFLVQENG